MDQQPNHPFYGKHLKDTKPQFQEIISSSKTFTEQAEILLKEAIQELHTSNGEHTKALEYYFRALERNPFLPQAFNNMAVICHYVRLSPL